MKEKYCDTENYIQSTKQHILIYNLKNYKVWMKKCNLPICSVNKFQPTCQRADIDLHLEISACRSVKEDLILCISQHFKSFFFTVTVSVSHLLRRLLSVSVSLSLSLSLSLSSYVVFCSVSVSQPHCLGYLSLASLTNSSALSRDTRQSCRQTIQRTITLFW